MTPGTYARFETTEGTFTVLDADKAVDRRDVPGGPARNRVLAAIEQAETELSADS